MKKRISKSANMYVMFGLLAVLFVSLGYLSMQSREGFKEGADSTADLAKMLIPLLESKEKKPEAAEAKKEKFKGKQGFRGREGLETMGLPMPCIDGKKWDPVSKSCK